jgi:SAM-dependent methyltransferase
MTSGSRMVAGRKSTKYQAFRFSDIWDSPLHDFPIRDEVLHQYFVLPPEAKVLEIGPGSGFTSFWLSRNVRHLSLVDVAPGNVKKLKHALSGLGNVSVVCADVCQPGLKRKVGDGFDAAYAIEVLEFLSDPGKCVKNLADVLRPDGQLLLQFPNYPPPRSQGISYFPRREDLDGVMQAAGFASWDVYALRLRPLANALYRVFHERPIELYRRLRDRGGTALPLNYDEVWAFQQGQRLERYKCAVHSVWTILAAFIHAGGPCFAREALGGAVVNRNLLVVARR